jgi:hypothetical protein
MEDLCGSWQLTDHTTVDRYGKEKKWGKNFRGLLIYEKSGHMSVSLNKDIEGNADDLRNVFDSILFYAGKFKVANNKVTHIVSLASDPNRVGKELVRDYVLKGDVLILSGETDLGVAQACWQRI